MRSTLVETIQIAASAASVTLQTIDSLEAVASFGDCAAVFRWRCVLIRATRDRGQIFIDVAPASRPGQFMPVEDLETAFGWTSLDALVARRAPEPLEAVFARLATSVGEMDAAFADGRVDATLEKLRIARARRADATQRAMGAAGGE